MPIRNPGIGVVAEHALVPDQARSPRKIRPVVTRVHSPGTALFGVPSKRQLLQGVPVRQVKKGSRMIARTDDEIHLLLVDVGFLAIESDLPAALIILTAALDHGKVAVGRGVIERLPRCEIPGRASLLRSEEHTS